VGLQNTQQALTSNNILYSGAGEDSDEAYQPVFTNNLGVSIAWLANCDRTGQIIQEMIPQPTDSRHGDIVIQVNGCGWVCWKAGAVDLGIKNDWRKSFVVVQIKNKITQRMGDQFAIIGFKTLDDVGMMYNHQISALVDGKMTNFPVPHMRYIQKRWVIFILQ